MQSTLIYMFYYAILVLGNQQHDYNYYLSSIVYSLDIMFCLPMWMSPKKTAVDGSATLVFAPYHQVD